MFAVLYCILVVCGYVSIVALVLLALVFVDHVRMKRRNKQKRTENANTLIVIGSGGHTMEMMKLLGSLSEKYSPRAYVIANTDTTSQHKVIEYESERNRKYKNQHRTYQVIRTQRSREVSQSLLSTILTTFVALKDAYRILWDHKPDLLLCNGPGTCVPLCFVAYLYRLFGLSSTRILYVESMCRVKTLSLSGQLLYFIADRLVVQWEQLLAEYPKADYIGRLT